MILYVLHKHPKDDLSLFAVDLLLHPEAAGALLLPPAQPVLFSVYETVFLK
jgi:hypothetical protein